MPGGTEAATQRAAEAERRHQRILRAAVALFSDRGFADTRIEDIAERAGVAKGTVLLHFAGKEALLACVVDAMLQAAIARITAAATMPGGPAERLATLAAALHQELRYPGPGSLAWLIIRDAWHDPELSRRLDQDLRQQMRRLAAAIIRDGIAAGRFRPCDPERMADLLIDPLVLQALWWHAVARHAPGASAAPDGDGFAAHRDTVMVALGA